MSVGPDILSGLHEQSVAAFDGDDTLWVDSTGEQEWERRFKHLAADCLPHREMCDHFRAHLNDTGFTIDGVRDALLASGRETCGDELPPEWEDEVAALPDLAQGLSIEPAKGLDQALAAFRDAGYVLWIITKGDVIRRAIKLARFDQCRRFSHIEIVSQKTVAAYWHILANTGIEPSRFLMIGDAFTEDILPVLRLGGRAAYVPAGRWSLLRPLEGFIPGTRLRACRSLQHAANACLAAK